MKLWNKKKRYKDDETKKEKKEREIKNNFFENIYLSEMEDSFFSFGFDTEELGKPPK